jgi:hypothetical protein
MAEVEIPYYKVVSVFDVSQTEGKELPEIAAQLTDGVEGYKEMMDALKKSSPTPISFENFEKIRSTANGYYDHAEKRIAVKAGMGEAQTVKTMIHEIAHAKLHDIDLVKPKDGQVQKNTETREVEAEAVAYTVCQRYGIDTSDYSFGYIAGWSSGKELPELNASLETIRDAAGALISDIDKHLGIEKPRENYSTRTDGGRTGGDATRGKAGREERRKPSVKEKLRRGTDKGQYRKPGRETPGRAARTPKPKGKELPGAGGR